VIRGSAAAAARIPVESVIVAVDGSPVNGPSELTRLVTAAGRGREVLVEFYYRGRLERRNVSLGQNTGNPRDAGRWQAADRDNEGDRGDEGQPERPLPERPLPTEHPAEEPLSNTDDLQERVRMLEARLLQLERLIERLLPPPSETPAES